MKLTQQQLEAHLWGAACWACGFRRELPVPALDTQTATAQILDSADIAIQRLSVVVERARDTKRYSSIIFWNSWRKSIRVRLRRTVRTSFNEIAPRSF